MLNMPMIGDRVTALGLTDAQVRSVVGASLHALARDPDHRTVGLTLLVRLSRLLELPLDDLVLTDDPHVHPPEQPEPTALGGAQLRDDYLLVGLLATYNGLAIARTVSLLGWTRTRLDAALAVVGEHLAPTALRVVATDEHLTLMLRPDVIPAVVRTQFEHDHLLHHPLDPNTAVAVLALVREKILEPFPELDDDRPYTRPSSFNAAYLVSRRLAVPIAAPASGTDTTEVQIHPDVMFALGLAHTPATNHV